MQDQRLTKGYKPIQRIVILTGAFTDLVKVLYSAIAELDKDHDLERVTEDASE